MLAHNRYAQVWFSCGFPTERTKPTPWCVNNHLSEHPGTKPRHNGLPQVPEKSGLCRKPWEVSGRCHPGRSTTPIRRPLIPTSARTIRPMVRTSISTNRRTALSSPQETGKAPQAVHTFPRAYGIPSCGPRAPSASSITPRELYLTRRFSWGSPHQAVAMGCPVNPSGTVAPILADPPTPNRT